MERPRFTIVYLAALLFLGACDAPIELRQEVRKSFEVVGVSVVDVGSNNAQINDLMVLQDGDLLIAMEARFTGAPRFAIARLNEKGILKPSFNHRGPVPGVHSVQFGREDYPVSLSYDTFGNVFVIGRSLYSMNPMTLKRNFDIAIAKFRSDGSLDSTFGEGGKVLNSFYSKNHDYGRRIFPQDDGSLLVVGSLVGRRQSGTPIHWFLIARFLSDGSLDSKFGFQKHQIDFDTDSKAFDAYIDDVGRIVVGGRVGDDLGSSGQNDFALMRFLPDGRVDYDFGLAGRLRIPMSHEEDVAWSVVPQGKKILIAGRVGNIPYSNFGIARVTENGVVDFTFGNEGKVIVGSHEKFDVARDLVVDRHGRIVLIGRTKERGTLDFAALRFSRDGKLDKSFGERGKLIIDLEGRGKDDIALVGGLSQDESKLYMAGRHYLKGSHSDGGISHVAVAEIHYEDFLGPEPNDDPLVFIGGGIKSAADRKNLSSISNFKSK